jgi:hypothetical protein
MPTISARGAVGDGNMQTITMRRHDSRRRTLTLMKDTRDRRGLDRMAEINSVKAFAVIKRSGLYVSVPILAPVPVIFTCFILVQEHLIPMYINAGELYYC